MVIKYLLGLSLGIGILLISASPVWAQLSNQERKALKKELRKMEPEELKAIREKQEDQNEQLSKLKGETSRLQEELDDKTKALQALKEKHGQLEEEYKSVMMEKAHEELHAENWEEGVVFRVQIGALTEAEYNREIPSGFSMDVEHKDDLQRMVLGYYRDYEEANTFKKLMRKLGVRTAWIVPYRDGERVPLKEVLDQVIE